MAQPEAREQLGAALGRIASGIFILTASDGRRQTGMLASWVQQCSFDPPAVSVAVKKGRYVADWIHNSGRFTINILDEAQTDVVGHFGRGFEPDQEAFTDVPIRCRDAAPPILEEALAYLDCRVVHRYDAGDHDLFIGEVESGALLNDGRPMIHVRKSGFHY